MRALSLAAAAIALFASAASTVPASLAAAPSATAVRSAPSIPSASAVTAASVAPSAPVTPSGARDHDYSIIMSGRPKGSLSVIDDSTGTRQVKWSYDDRGRGPDLRSTRRVDANGLPTELTIDGTDYRKAPIAERFTTSGSEASWHSDADEGHGPTGGFYLANQASDEDIAALARALLTAGGQMQLLPAGKAQIETILSRPFTAGGQTTEATLYLISGLELQPVSVWLDVDRELFAAGGSWLGTVRRGFEAAQPQVLAAQGEATSHRAALQAQWLQERPSGPVAITHANLFDPQTRTLQPNTTVLVEGDRVVSVVSDRRARFPRGTRVIDATGKTLLPGLWDMHVHLLNESDGLLDLMAGVTTVRDMGNEAPRLDSLMARFESGELPGPHVIKALLIDGKGPLSAPLGATADTPEEIRDIIDRGAKSGYAQVKLYSSLKPELVPVAVQAAHEHGMRISGHVPASMSMRQVVEDGFDEVQHAYFWFLNFMSADVQARTNSPLRFSDVGEHGHELDLNSAPVRDFVRLIADRHTVLDPTLVAFEGMFVGVKGQDMPWMLPWAQRMPISTLRSGRSGGRGTTPELKAAYTSSFESVKRMLKLFYDAGVPIVPGTDGSAFLYSRELELYVEAGLPAKDVLYAATLGSARVMKQDGRSGSIAAGKRADLVLIDGNPLEQMADIRRTNLVMKGGVIFNGAALATAAGMTAPDMPSMGLMSKAPLHYDVKANFSPQAGTLSSDVTITIPPGPPVDETFVLSRRFSLHHATIEGPAELDVGKVDKPFPDMQAFRVHSFDARHAPVTLRIAYDGPIDFPADKDAIPLTRLIELNAENMWVPLENHIAQPFTLAADLTGIPQDMMSVSQGDVTHSHDEVRINRTVPDVDFAFIAAVDLKRVAADGVEMYARDPDNPVVALFRKHAVAAIAYYRKFLGAPAFRLLRIVVVPRVHSEHAYARAAYIVFAEAPPRPAEAGPLPERKPAEYAAHEVGHMWWLRANAQSEDNWLNESLAEYSALRYVAATLGDAEREAYMADYPAKAAQSGAIIGHGRPKAPAVYQRGPLLLFALDRQIGRNGMDRFLSELARQPVLTTAVAMKVLGSVAGQGVADSFEAQLRAEQYPSQ